MIQPKISVVTVCYNAVETIEKTMLSVINQTYANIEYIIIDGGSTDGTVDIIKKYADRIAYWVSEPDKGIYDAMNKGIKVATGEWINFMNAGDSFVNHDSIHSLASSFRDENKIVYGYIIKLYEKCKSYGRPIKKKNPDEIDFILWGIDHQAAFIKKEMFEKYGLYDTTYRLASDWYFFMKVAGIHKENILYVDKPIAYFAMNGASTIHQELYLQEMNDILQSIHGKDFVFVRELAEYRKSSFIRWLLKIRLRIKKNGIGTKLRFFQHVILHK